MSDWQGEEGAHWAGSADRYTRMLGGFGALVLDAASIAPGHRVLDVGCGCGDLSIAAGRSTGPTGVVRGVDLSEAMLAVAGERTRAEGLGHVGFVAEDAAAYGGEPGGFDVALSRFGVMFFPDPAGAFANLRSLLAPGGRLVFACWQDVVHNDWMIVPGAAVAEVLPLPTSGLPGGPGPFAFADPQYVEEVLVGAGFAQVSIDAVTAPVWLGPDAVDAAAFLRTTGMGRVVFAGAAPDQIDAATASVVAALEPHVAEHGIELPGAAWLVTAAG